MNVDEAMAYAKQLSGGSLNFSHHSNPRILAIGALYNEVERLRAELAAVKDEVERIKEQVLAFALWFNGDGSPVDGFRFREERKKLFAMVGVTLPQVKNKQEGDNERG